MRFLNDVGGGNVKRLLDNQMVEIQTKDGWDMPYLVSELVVIPDDPDQEPYRAEPNTVFVKDANYQNCTKKMSCLIRLLRM